MTSHDDLLSRLQSLNCHDFVDHIQKSQPDDKLLDIFIKLKSLCEQYIDTINAKSKIKSKQKYYLNCKTSDFIQFKFKINKYIDEHFNNIIKLFSDKTNTNPQVSNARQFMIYLIQNKYITNDTSKQCYDVTILFEIFTELKLFNSQINAIFIEFQVTSVQCS